jgi:hypothetical protein
MDYEREAARGQSLVGDHAVPDRMTQIDDAPRRSLDVGFAICRGKRLQCLRSFVRLLDDRLVELLAAKVRLEDTPKLGLRVQPLHYSPGTRRMAHNRPRPLRIQKPYPHDQTRA